MSALVTILRVFIFLLLILQAFAGSIKAITYKPAQQSAVTSYFDAISAQEEEITGSISSLQTLQISDALISPIPSFQFSFVEVLYGFLYVVFSFYAVTRIQEVLSFFTRTYFRTLFSSLILINAP